jgi:hypothetical protein
MISEQDQPLKKPYQTPTLRVYGDIQTLSRNVNAGGPVFDGMPGKTA